MYKERLNTTLLFPSFDKWATFIQQHDQRQLSKQEQLGKSLKYITPEGVANTIVFYNPYDSFQSKDLRPFVITQKYINPQGKFEIEVNLYNDNLSNKLDITPSIDYLTRIAVTSESCFSGDEWNNTQEVFMALNEGYLNQLKTEKLAPNNAKGRVWIRRAKHEIVATIEGLLGQPNLPLADDTLRRICQDSGFEFEFDAIAKVTRGTIDGISFNLHYARDSALSQDNTWRALTGSNSKNPFIFPVQVDVQK